MKTRHFKWTRIALLASSLVFAQACGDDETTTESSAEFDVETCVNRWSEAYSLRFNAGETFFLPSLSSAAECTGLSWSLPSSPAGNLNELVQGQDHDRFTPHISGTYTFVLQRDGASVGVTQTLEVVNPLLRPFHNYNYFPAPSVATLVGNELWVAGVYSPEVARLDPATGSLGSAITVGQWPVSLAYVESVNEVLVANKASDTLGVISVAAGRQVDAIWVGDEPTEVIWDDARELAYVSLAAAGQVAVVDIMSRSLVKTIDAVFDPGAMAMSPDGTKLFVASHRSGQSNMYPYEDRGSDTELDIAVIDLESQEVEGFILEVSSTIHDLLFDADGKLWVSATGNQTEGSLNNPDDRSFEHEIFQLNASIGAAVRGAEVDLSRQASSTGSTGNIQGFTVCGSSIWVVAEGANQLLELNGDLSEKSRIAIEGRPRAVLCAPGDTPWVISSNRGMAHEIVDGAALEYDLGLTERRDQLLIDGLELFSAQGDGVGDNRSCSSCHVDGLSDGVVWNAGPVPNRQVTRPFRWLEGTSLIGWDGYVGSVKISGFVGGSTINHRGNTAEAKAMGAYIASIMPAPAANSWTHRDGSFSDEALEGKDIFENKAACTGCHSGPATTNKQVFDEGLTPGKTDVPSLVDVSKVGAWYKTGIMPTLRATVADTAIKFGRELTESEIDKVTRYLEELTGRDFFVLNANLGPDSEKFPVDGNVVLTFSYPVLNDPSNLSLLTLRDAGGAEVRADVSVDGRHVTLTPRGSLDFNTTYTVDVADGFKADDGRSVMAEAFVITTAKAPSLELNGDYKITVKVPMLNFQEGAFEMDNLVEQSSTFSATATENGADVLIDYGADMIFDDIFVISEDKLITNHIPIAVGPSFLNGTPIIATVEDTDGDGVVDLVDGTFKLTGPGVDLEDIEVKIEKSVPSAGGCVEGSEGDAAPTVTQDGDDVVIDWEGGSLALYVATPDATLPLGPGAVQGGETFWAISASSFPTTFSGPVTYGVVPEGGSDVSETNGAPVGGAPLESGKCYRFSVVVDFAYSHTTILWP